MTHVFTFLIGVVLYVTIVMEPYGKSYSFDNMQDTLDRCETLERRYHDAFALRSNLRSLTTRCGNRTRIIYWNRKVGK